MSAWFQMLNRIMDRFGNGSGFNLALEWVERHLGFICGIDSKTLLELEAELVWNQNGFKDTLDSNVG